MPSINRAGSCLCISPATVARRLGGASAFRHWTDPSNQNRHGQSDLHRGASIAGQPLLGRGDFRRPADAGDILSRLVIVFRHRPRALSRNRRVAGHGRAAGADHIDHPDRGGAHHRLWRPVRHRRGFLADLRFCAFSRLLFLVSRRAFRRPRLPAIWIAAGAALSAALRSASGELLSPLGARGVSNPIR